MTQILQVLGSTGGIVYTNASTRFFPAGSAGNSGSSAATETNVVQIICREAGTHSNFYTNVYSNPSTTNVTLRFRKNAANGNQVITITALTPGEYTDNTNTDSIVAGDKIDFQSSGGTTGNATASSVTTLFSPTTTTNTSSRFSIAGGISPASSTTYYNGLCGNIFTNTTEANCQYKAKFSGTLKNMAVDINTNTASTGTAKSRKNGADGNLSISIGSGVTGILEDTTNSDSFSSGDLLNTDLVTGSVTTLGYQAVSVDMLTTDGNTTFITCNPRNNITQNNNLTRYLVINGSISILQTTEGNSQTKAQVAFTGSFLAVLISANTVTAASTVTLRKNTGNGNQSVSVTASTTGYFEDSTHTDSIITTDEINYQLTTGATGTSLTLQLISMMTSYGGTVVAVITYISEWFGD